MMAWITLTGCEQPRLQDPPYDAFWRTGFFGHGSGLIGEFNVNLYSFSRRCDSCHAQPIKKHDNIGACHNCHQPHVSGWKHSLVSLEHRRIFPLLNNEYHGELECIDCHNGTGSTSQFYGISCTHCHNHTLADLIYNHELMDNFSDLDLTSDVGCVNCHSRTGSDFHKYADQYINIWDEN